jgi:hypothetical protein
LQPTRLFHFSCTRNRNTAQFDARKAAVRDRLVRVVARLWATVASATGSTRPITVLHHIKMHACKRPLGAAVSWSAGYFHKGRRLNHMLQRLWTPRLRCGLSILFYGIFCLQSYVHRDSVRLPYSLFFFGMSALCVLFLYLLEHASNRSEEIVGTVGSYFFRIVGCVSVLVYLFGWQHVVPRDVVRRLF